MAPTKPSLASLKQHLKHYDRDELVEQIAELFKRFQPMQD